MGTFMLLAAIASGGTFTEAAGVELPSDAVEQRLLREYGGVLLTEAVAPSSVRVEDEAAVTAFQERVPTAEVTVDGVSIRLQTPAAEALGRARDALAAQGVTLVLQGKRPAGRTYAETETAWTSRVGPCLDHHLGIGAVSVPDADRVRALSGMAQVAAVLELEEIGLRCNTFFDRSILTSVAAPGASQHLFLLAVDVQPARDPRVVAAMAAEGWHRTVWSDRPHFTYLGVGVDALPALGLVERPWAESTYWVPEVQHRNPVE